MKIEYSTGKVIEPAVIQIWEDNHSERPGFFRAFWCESPDSGSGSPVVGYCSSGGSHKTISAVIAECRKLGYSDAIYRNGRLIRPPMITFETGLDIRAREVDSPTVARFHVGGGVYRFCVIGTAYGYWHTIGGDVRVWKTASGARRAASRYVGI